MTLQDLLEVLGPYHCLMDLRVELDAILDAVTSLSPPTSVLEIGTFYGATSAAIAKCVPSVLVTSIDLPDPTTTKWNPHDASETGVAHRVLGVEVEQLRMDVVDFVTERRFDVVFVDGDHDQAYRDCTIARKLLTPRGFILVHDYTSPADTDRPDWTVTVEQAVTRWLVDYPEFRLTRLPGLLVRLDR